MTTDPDQLRPDHLPTPFSAEEIRVGCQPGRTIRSLVVRSGGEPYVRVTRFVSGDADGTEQESWTETRDGVRLTESEVRRSQWLEFQEHASMPAATTEIHEERIEVPAGHFDCLRYTRREGDSVSTFWFAKSAPGMPLRFEERVDGEVVVSSTAITSRRPSPNRLCRPPALVGGGQGWQTVASPSEASTMSQALDPSHVETAKSALERHEWADAFRLLSDADAMGGLAPDDLELLAQAAWWVGRLPVAIEARERAYGAFAKAGQREKAAHTAILLGNDNLLRLAIPVATAWLHRAERLIEGMDENAGHGWIAATRAFQGNLTGDLDEALAQASIAVEIAGRVGDRDLAAQGLSAKGATLVAMGRVDEGLALLDEATVSAVAGELNPTTAGGVSCAAIGTCAALGDWRRAAEWTEAQDRWCQREGISGFPGMCRLHRAEIKRIRGSWGEAEAEARRASDELKGFIPAAVGLALYQIGEIRLRRGDLPTAEETLLRAHTFGRDPEPALSLLRLAQGKVDLASMSIKRALDESAREPSWWAPPESKLYRLSLLPAQVEIALAAGDLATARAAADELASLAEGFPSLQTKASSASALGAVLVAEGAAPEGTQALRRAIQLWGELDAPYESARARMVLADAYAAEGSRERAVLEVQTARSAFERLGAIPDLRLADEALTTLEVPLDARSPGTSVERVVRTFVFTDVVDSTRLAELLGDEAWDRLIRWHDQTMRSLVAEHNGEEIKATGDGFFLAFGEPEPAIECAVAIQRRLDEQRRAQGFALSVRIGAHRSEASRAGLDYVGRGVNQAARICREAAGAEILVSASTLAASRRTFAESGRRTLELRGVATPAEVVSIVWR